MPYFDKYGEFFGRKGPKGNVSILHTSDGSPATQLDADAYPVGSALGVRYEHPNGIVLNMEDAARLGIEWR